MSRESRRLVWALRLLALCLVGLTLAAPLLREEAAWGLWPAVYLPVGWRWALAAITAGLALFSDRLPTGWREGSPSRANRALSLSKGPSKSAPHAASTSSAGVAVPESKWPPGWLRGMSSSASRMRWLIALAAAVPFYLFRLQHLRWGDAYILIHAIPHPQAQLTYTWQAPLDLFLHAKAWALGNRLFGWPDPTPVYWIISTAAGVIFVRVLLELANWLGRDRVERVLLFGLIASLGTMQFFFGYIENYSLMAVGVLIYIWLAVRAVRGEVALLWPATALALTHAFHPSTIVLAPSLLYLAWLIPDPPSPFPAREGGAAPPPLLSGDARRAGRGVRSLLQIALPYLLVLLGVIAFMTAGGHALDALLGADAPGGGDRNWFVPLFAASTRWEHYTMFSLGHLLDITNEQLLIAPAIWPGMLLAALLAWPRLPRRDPAFRLLLLLALLYALLTITWNADYGGQRDWDLFAPASLPAALLLGYTLARALPERRALSAASWALIAVQFFRLLMWIYQNTLPWTPT